MALNDLSQVSEVTVQRMKGATQKVGTPSVTVYELDGSNNVEHCSGATLPTLADAGYAKGCVFTLTTGGSATSVYINTGDATSCNFVAFTGESGIQYVEVALSNAQIKALATTAVVIIPAAGAGKVNYYVDGVIEHKVGAADFATSHTITAKYKSDASGATVSTTLTDAFISGGVTSKISTLKQLVTDITTATKADYENQPISIKASANPTLGDGTGLVKMWYRVFTTGL